MVCANAEEHSTATAAYREIKNPCCFKNVKISLTYIDEQMAWINTDIYPA